MEESLFIQYVREYLDGVILETIETINGGDPLTYRHRTELTPTYSVSGKWESNSNSNTFVAADVIAMDSSIPLKLRDAIASYSGDVPKIAMEMQLKESQLTAIYAILRQGGVQTEALRKIFADTPKCLVGVLEQREALYLQGLSTGVAVVADANNTGTGIRLDYGYLPANKFGVATLWTNVASTPFTDLARAKKTANVPITKWKIDPSTLENVLNTTQAKSLYGFGIGFTGDVSSVPSPTLEQMNATTRSRFGFVFDVIDRTIVYEKNGIRTQVTPWDSGAVVGVSTDNLGDLVYSRLAEQDAPVSGVTYRESENGILLSKYRVNRPALMEFTSSQSRSVPVINGVQGIVLVDSQTVQA